MSTISDKRVHFEAKSSEGEDRTLRQTMVAALAGQHYSSGGSIYVTMTSPGKWTAAGFRKDAHVWSGEDWDPADNWLSDLITEATEGGVVKSWTWSVSVTPFTQVVVGFDATGDTEVDGLVFGMPAEVMLPPEAIEYFVAQSRVLWGAAWSPLT